MKTGLKVFLVFLGALLIIAGGAAWYAWDQIQPVAAQTEPVRIEIERGSGVSSISSKLESNGIIKNKLLFRGYLKYKNEGTKFMAGTYDFMPGMTYEEIITKLNTGDVVQEEMVKFTIPEGLTIEEIADKLSSEKIVDRAAFLQAADKIQASGELPLGAKVEGETQHPLEGYLFPSTYEMKVGSTEEDIVNRMLKEMDKRVTAIADWEAKMKKQGLNAHQLMTIASLIEREVVVDEERALVAGVIYNRMAKGMPLQIDATVQYALDKPKERLYYKDLEIDSPYNTYKIDGLPPGPIASPSEASIEAALNPEESEYLYYVTKKDGTQTHLFGKTYDEHLANIEKSKKQSGE